DDRHVLVGRVQARQVARRVLDSPDNTGLRVREQSHVVTPERRDQASPPGLEGLELLTLLKSLRLGQTLFVAGAFAAHERTENYTRAGCKPLNLHCGRGVRVKQSEARLSKRFAPSHRCGFQTACNQLRYARLFRMSCIPYEPHIPEHWCYPTARPPESA